jgi:hypothetical protein
VRSQQRSQAQRLVSALRWLDLYPDADVDAITAKLIDVIGIIVE